jgi:hypothetical protein
MDYLKVFKFVKKVVDWWEKIKAVLGFGPADSSGSEGKPVTPRKRSKG